MKKNVLALSIAAMIGGLGFAGAASAAVFVGTGAGATTAVDLTAATLTKATAATLDVSEGGVGHALVVPYFNAQNGNMTVLHVVNTDQINGKAVKVRFRGAANSDDILDFQVFMSPGDVWTAAVTAGSNGVAQIVTADNTCTVPALTAGVPQQFVLNRLNANLTADQKADQSREGYVEIFNMADIAGDKVWNADGTLGGALNSPLYTATKHVAGVAPCSVAGSAARTALNTVAITDHTEATAATAGFNTPTGGLMGDWYIINVPQTTTFSGGATAIAADARGNFMHFPQTDGAVGAPAINAFTADPLFRTDSLLATGAAAPAVPAIAAANYDLPDMSTPFVAADITAPKAQATKLTAALAVTSITNQYANDASITAKTDWTFSMPTRRYSVAANYAAITGNTAATSANSANPAYRLFTDLAAATAVGDWFYPANAVAGREAAGNTTVDAKGNICVFADVGGQKFYDREETTAGAATPGPVFSPGTPGVTPRVSFCGEVSVLAFKDDGNSVLAANVARSTLTSGAYVNGWGVVNTTNTGTGLPILGSSFIKLSNPNVGTGVSGTYGITWPHRFTK